MVGIYSIESRESTEIESLSSLPGSTWYWLVNASENRDFQNVVMDSIRSGWEEASSFVEQKGLGRLESRVKLASKNYATEVAYILKIAGFLEKKSLSKTECSELDETVEKLTGKAASLLYKSVSHNHAKAAYHYARSMGDLKTNFLCRRVSKKGFSETELMAVEEDIELEYYQYAANLGSLDAKIALERRYRTQGNLSEEVEKARHKLAHDFAKFLKKECRPLHYKFQIMKDLFFGFGISQNLLKAESKAVDIGKNTGTDQQMCEEAKIFADLCSLLQKEGLTVEEYRELFELSEEISQRGYPSFFENVQSAQAAYNIGELIKLLKSPVESQYRAYKRAADLGSLQAKRILEKSLRGSYSEIEGASRLAHQLARELEESVKEPYYTLQVMRDLFLGFGAAQDLRAAKERADLYSRDRTDQKMCEQAETIARMCELLETGDLSSEEYSELDRLGHKLSKSDLSFFLKNMESERIKLIWTKSQILAGLQLLFADSKTLEAKRSIEKFVRRRYGADPKGLAHGLTKELEEMENSPYYTFEIAKDLLLGLNTDQNLEAAGARATALCKNSQLSQEMSEQVQLIARVCELLQKNGLQAEEYEELYSLMKKNFKEQCSTFHRQIISIPVACNWAKCVELAKEPFQAQAYQRAAELGSLQAKILLEDRCRNLYQGELEAGLAHRFAKELEKELGREDRLYYTMQVIKDLFLGEYVSQDLSEARSRAKGIIQDEQMQEDICEKAYQIVLATEILQGEVSMKEIPKLSLCMNKFFGNQGFAMNVLCNSEVGIALSLQKLVEESRRGFPHKKYSKNWVSTD